jgi:hypothetical protein
MNTTPSTTPDRRHPSGATLAELLITAAIAAAVSLGVVGTFVWCSQQANLCSKMAWSQSEAMHASTKLTMYLRNATGVYDIDAEEGTWVDVEFPDGTIGHLVYSNAVPEIRDGQLVLLHTNGTDTIIARGVTEVQDSRGFTMPVFSQPHPDALRVVYRVAEPVSVGLRAANDGLYAAAEKIAVHFRNCDK